MHIPTGLILHAYDIAEMRCNDSDIDLSYEELLFSSKKLAELFLSSVQIKGLERKKTKFTHVEKIFLDEIINSNVNTDRIELRLNDLFDHFQGYMQLTDNRDNMYIWSPEDTINLLDKFNIIDCVKINELCFFKASTLKPDSYDYTEFYSNTKYRLNYKDLYPQEEFEIVEVTTHISVRRPSQKEFKTLVADVLKNATIPKKIKDRFEVFINP